jgi:serine/threonine-protein kinase
MGTDDPYIGVRIADGGYKLVAKIGEGAMGSVYRAIQEETGTEVAVKILHMKFALEREFVERFKREVKVLGSLRHPNTVRIITDGEMEDSSLYIVMELLTGRGLDHALKHDGPWPLDRAISMVLRVCYALEEAHRLGIVHRDLKPENIFLVQRPGGLEIPKLLDFGLAKMSRGGDSGSMSLTQEGDILGTPAFMSPEQSFGEALDGRADIYSLAVILYELLTGQLPYEESSSGPQIARYLNEPIPIDQRVEGLTFPPGLWEVLARALQKLPEDRFSTAMEMADALKPFNTMHLSIAPPAVRPKGTPPPGADQKPPKTPLPPRTPIPPSTPVPPPPSTRRGPMHTLPTLSRERRMAQQTSRSRVVGIVVVAVLLLAAVVAVVLLRK